MGVLPIIGLLGSVRVQEDVSPRGYKTRNVIAWVCPSCCANSMLNSRPGPNAHQNIVTSASADHEDITEQFLRNLVKSEVPRLVRSRSRALLVEEMEVCLGRARVDLAVIADLLIGIEIKGPKDDVARLPHQALAYSKCFDRVVLLVDESLVDKARPLVPTWWGIVVAMRREGQFEYRFERRPRLNPDLDIEVVLSLLWRDEIDVLSQELLGTATKPRSSKRAIRTELRKHIAVDVLHHATLNKLRDRSDWRTVPIHEGLAVA